MAAKYTQEEWQAIFDQAERDLPSEDVVHVAPSVDSAAFRHSVDHTLLKTDATATQIDNLSVDAIRYGLKNREERAKALPAKFVCVRPEWVERAVRIVQGSRVAVVCVIGFHQGTQSSNEKAIEAKKAVDAGAKELDMVINWPLLKAKQSSEVYADIAAVRSVAPRPIILKVILETSQLSRHEIIAGCKIAEAAEADFVKTSTGFNGQGATQENVALMRSVVGKDVKVKASGGIKTRSDCISMMEAGAERIGTSNGVGIVLEQ